MAAYNSEQNYDLKRHDNGVWYIHWTDGRRSKRESTGQKEKGKAQIYLGEWLVGKKVDDTEGAHLIRDLWTVYFEKHVEKNTSSADQIASLWKNLSSHFGDLLLSDVNSDVVDDYVAKRMTGKLGKASVSGSVRNELTLFRACLNWCAAPKQKIVAKAAMPVFDLPASSPARDRWLKLPEVQRLLDAARERRVVLAKRTQDGTEGLLSRYERFLWLALETTARKTAILELTWDRVDFETGVIHYNVPGRKVTKKRRVSVPISKALLPILQRAFEERTTEYVCDRPTNVYVEILKIAKLAGLKDVSPHVLRHTAATHMCRRGVPLWTVAGILGNTVAMVEKVYGHHCPDGLRSGVEAISSGVLEPAE